MVRSSNVAAENPERVRDLKAKLAQWEREVQVPAAAVPRPVPAKR